VLEMLDLRNLDYNIDLTGFDRQEIDHCCSPSRRTRTRMTRPQPPENPASRAGDLWLCGKHRILCGDTTSREAVARLLGDRKPFVHRITFIDSEGKVAPNISCSRKVTVSDRWKR